MQDPETGAAKAENRIKSIGSGVMGFFTDFREFMLQDDVINLAVGIIIGTAFVKDLFSPFIALCGSGGNLDELFLVLRHGNGNSSEYKTLSEAKAAGAVTLNYGRFLESVVNLLMVSVCVFLTIKCIMRIRNNNIDRSAETTKRKESTNRANCVKCRETVNKLALKCPHCGMEPVEFAAFGCEDVENGDSEDELLKQEASQQLNQGVKVKMAGGMF